MWTIITSAFQALFVVGLPLFLLSLGMVWWALHKGTIEGNNVKDLQKDIDALPKRQKDKEKKEKLNPVHEKWMSFGGGFYGLVALYTWLIIEWGEVKDLIGGLGDLIFRLDLGVLITFFIESLMNFITAIAWPWYWLRSIDSDPWVWIIVAYGGYWAGIQVAQKAAGRSWEGSPADFVRSLTSRDDDEV